MFSVNSLALIIHWNSHVAICGIHGTNLEQNCEALLRLVLGFPSVANTFKILYIQMKSRSKEASLNSNIRAEVA
jgi:hypothetical protein